MSLDPTLMALGGVKDPELEALARALETLTGGGGTETMPPMMPVTAQDPWEALAMSGGLSPSPAVTPVIGGGGFSTVAQGLLQGVNNFLGVPIAQAKTRVKARQDDQAAIRQAAAAATRENNVARRQLALQTLKSTLGAAGKDVLGKNVDSILELSRDRGRDAGFALGTALGIPRQDLEPILEHLPEVGVKSRGEETEMVTISGRQVPVPKSELPSLLARLEGIRTFHPSASSTGNMTKSQRRTAISDVIGRADQLARNESGVDDPYLPTAEKKAAQQRYPSLRKEHGLALAQAYIDAGLLDEGDLDAVRGGLSTGAVDTPPPPPPPPTGGGKNKANLSDQQIKGLLQSAGTRDVALKSLNQHRNEYDGDTYRRARLAIDKAFPSAGKAKP